MSNILKIVLAVGIIGLACGPSRDLEVSFHEPPLVVTVLQPEPVTVPEATPATLEPVEVVAEVISPHVFIPSVDDVRLCHVCDKAELDSVHVKPKAQPVAVIGRTSFGTQYSNCANGNCGPVSGGRPRLFGRFR